jgi:hypothetical protein
MPVCLKGTVGMPFFQSVVPKKFFQPADLPARKVKKNVPERESLKVFGYLYTE